MKNNITDFPYFDINTSSLIRNFLIYFCLFFIMEKWRKQNLWQNGIFMHEMSELKSEVRRYFQFE